MANSTQKLSAGAKQAAEQMTDDAVTAEMFANIIDRVSGAGDMAEAIEKLLDYDRRNGAMNFQYEKWLDHLYNLKVAVDNYRYGIEEAQHETIRFRETIEGDSRGCQ
jgi:hypothetical protein